jgi:hypothetical protein
MLTSRKLIVHFSMAVMLLAAAVPVSAAPPAAASVSTVRVRNITIPWAFPPPDGLSSFCSEIPEGVHINPNDLGSDRHKVVSQRNLGNGTRRIVVSDLITGTATDNFGRPYRFVYANGAIYDYDGAIVHARMHDSFTLIGGDVDFVVGFNWRWAYATASFAAREVTDEHGMVVDIAVEPFLFATNDGVSESPDILPGSWQPLSTRGDPFNCDPL